MLPDRSGISIANSETGHLPTWPLPTWRTIRLPHCRSRGAGWDVRTLLGVLVQHGLRGVCNAMSAAYLADLIAPDPPRLDRRSREQLQQDHAFQATLGWGCEVLQ